MVCYHPLKGYRSRDGRNPVTGGWKIVFNLREGYVDLPVEIPCGQCIGCRLEKSRQWAIRCVHEASLYEKNCFITLTFNDENLDLNLSLDKTDFQRFMKRLRKRYCDQRIRYYHCGEYGEILKRPHHHAILFNFDFEDKVLWQKRDNVALYRSKSLEELWPYGYASIGAATFESAAYVARYILKKVSGKNASVEAHYRGRVPEFTTMSRRPGIGRTWYIKYASDVYPSDYVVTRKGLKVRPPRYYDALYDLENPEEFKKIKQRRVRQAKTRAFREKITPHRLAMKEKCKELAIKSLKRNLD
ncbi:replication initiator protein [Peromfec virus RodF8_61]|uniref:Replication initiator protein n=1 Tax=Peromfec virus RodF8_61 TaxID=2929387 RepID=A0A976N218_9VIRU|nr:replication initiator protein [Peromfec virus RodF8_61]